MFRLIPRQLSQAIRFQPTRRLMPLNRAVLLYSYQKSFPSHYHPFHTGTMYLREENKDIADTESEVKAKHQMLIGFTCKVCNERSHHVMSKIAYTKGVVLIQCPGCKNRHLIADNLGWFRDSKTTVEDLVKEKGEGIRKIIVDEQGIERKGDLLEWLPEVTEDERRRKEEARLKADRIKDNEE